MLTKTLVQYVMIFNTQLFAKYLCGEYRPEISGEPMTFPRLARDALATLCD